MNRAPLVVAFAAFVVTVSAPFQARGDALRVELDARSETGLKAYCDGLRAAGAEGASRARVHRAYRRLCQLPPAATARSVNRLNFCDSLRVIPQQLKSGIAQDHKTVVEGLCPKDFAALIESTQIEPTATTSRSILSEGIINVAKSTLYSYLVETVMRRFCRAGILRKLFPQACLHVFPSRGIGKAADVGSPARVFEFFRRDIDALPLTLLTELRASGRFPGLQRFAGLVTPLFGALARLRPETRLADWMQRWMGDIAEVVGLARDTKDLPHKLCESGPTQPECWLGGVTALGSRVANELAKAPDLTHDQVPAALERTINETRAEAGASLGARVTRALPRIGRMYRALMNLHASVRAQLRRGAFIVELVPRMAGAVADVVGELVQSLEWTVTPPRGQVEVATSPASTAPPGPSSSAATGDARNIVDGVRVAGRAIQAALRKDYGTIANVFVELFEKVVGRPLSSVARAVRVVMAIVLAPDAKSAEDVIEKAVADTGGYTTKYGDYKDHVVSINAYGGFFTGYRYVETPTAQQSQVGTMVVQTLANRHRAAFRLAAPIGVDWTFKRSKRHHHGLFFHVADPLAITLVDQDGRAAESDWAVMVNLGAYYRWGAFGSPISVMLGASYHPFLNSPAGKGGFQAGVMLAIDLPLFVF